ncbi:uncharacterized protein BJX67DRAFT_354552 [Aspergillus lucknowensis]|uniref:Uncharacterized protein n=1 Tax=Aspergillus lucknowensis TaxID=176173 RepID=A0ABR4LQ53_9EURO
MCWNQARVEEALDPNLPFPIGVSACLNSTCAIILTLAFCSAVLFSKVREPRA